MKVYLVDGPPVAARPFEDPGEMADKLSPENVEIDWAALARPLETGEIKPVAAE